MPVSLRELVRRVVACALYYSGLLWLLAFVRLRNRAVVLMYHRVLPDETDCFSTPSIVVSPDTFSTHMKFLRRHFRVLSLQQLRQHLEDRRPFPSRSCIVTFDDGWTDNVVHAMPILRAHAVPAVFFVATDFVGSTKCFWQERLSRRLYLATKVPDAHHIVTALLGEEFHRLSPKRLRSAIHEAVRHLKDRRKPQEIDAAELQLEAALTKAGTQIAQNGEDRFMQWMEVARLELEGRCDVGAHGSSHAPLTLLPDELVERELLKCRRDIEANIGHTTEAIAYPNGDHDERIVNLAYRAGFRIGFTTVRGVLDAGDDPMRIRRINIHNSAARTTAELLCTLLGVFRWYRSQAPIAHTRNR